jgi:hypothetical protein
MAFDAIKILSGQDDSVVAVVWWDGKTIRSNSAKILSLLKREEIQGRFFSDGKDFFDVIPYRFSSGYSYCRPAKVDESGEIV